MTTVALMLTWHLGSPDSWVVLYIGPDVFLPLTSALAAIAGVFLMFWRRIVGFVSRVFGRGRPDRPPQQPPDQQG